MGRALLSILLHCNKIMGFALLCFALNLIKNKKLKKKYVSSMYHGPATS